MKSVMFCKPECLALLLQAGADPEIPTAEGENVYKLSEKM
jgi:hypothetical protein